MSSHCFAGLTWRHLVWVTLALAAAQRRLPAFSFWATLLVFQTTTPQVNPQPLAAEARLTSPTARVSCWALLAISAASESTRTPAWVGLGEPCPLVGTCWAGCACGEWQKAFRPQGGTR